MTDQPPQNDALRSLKILAVLSILMSFASISTDIYLPALPVIGKDLGADNGAVELTISSYLIGFSLGQLLWGPLGDQYGRRGPITVGLLLFILGSAGCALSGSVGAMIGWRVVQAVGACASVVLSRAMVRDLYVDHHAARMLSTLMTVMAVAPLVGPSVGGLILHLASWPVIFWLLVAIGLLTIPALHLLPETLPREKRTRQSLGDTLVAYGQLLRHRRLMGYASIVGSFYGGMYAYIAGTPFAYISYHHVAPQHYGVLFAVGIVGIMATNQVNARLVGRLGLDRLMRFGASAAAGSGTLLALDAYTGWGGLWGLALPLFVFVSATGFIVANAITGALGCSPERAGAASALLGMFQYGTGILGSALVGYFADGTPRPMAFIIAFFGFGSLLGALCLRPLRRDGPPTTYSAPATGPKD